MTDMTLADIQKKLKAPKNQLNKFGGYKYRSCEDILEAVKPFIGDTPLILTDDIVEVGGRVYVKSIASIHGYSAIGFAREAESKKGMDEAQITAAATSYARKLALCGLFAIDDTRDAEATNSEAPSEFISPEQVKELEAMIMEVCDDGGVKFLDHIAVKTVDQIPASFFIEAKRQLNMKKAKLNK